MRKMTAFLSLSLFAPAIIPVTVASEPAAEHAPTAPAAAQPATKPNAVEALKLLTDGNARFVANTLQRPHIDPARVKLASQSDQGNYAYATILTCSDSRVPPEILFDAGIMDLFIVRVAGNVADTDEVGTIEYGTLHVKTPLLVVLGHTQCGAVKAVISHAKGTGHALEANIPPLVDNIVPAVKQTISDFPDANEAYLCTPAVKENVKTAIKDIFTKSVAVRNAVKAGKVKVVGGIYDLGSGKVDWMPDTIASDALTLAEKDPAAAQEKAPEHATPPATH